MVDMARRYNYPNKNRYRPKDEKAHFENAKYLVCTDKPFSLLGVSIKNIVSSYDYSKMKRECKKKANSHCQLCGRYIARSLHKDAPLDTRIYCHESFTIMPKEQLFRFDGLLAVCWECYLNLNPYLINKLLDEMKINQKEASRIRRWGVSLLNSFGLVPVPLEKITVFALEYRGFKYINDFYPQILDRAISRGVRVLRYQGVEKRLPSDCYYYKPVGE